MLCDDVIACHRLTEVYDGLDKCMPKIKDAHKFILSKEFATIADGFVDNTEELGRIAPLCNIPFPLTWIEFVHDDRPHWDPAGPHGSRPVDPTRHQGQPSRVGFLLEQIDKANHWAVHLFWRLRHVPPEDAAMDVNTSLMAIEFDGSLANGKEPLFESVKPRFANFGLKLMMSMKLLQPDVYDRLRAYAEEDWGGEFRFLLSTLGLLNARNVVQAQKIDNAKVNKHRVQKGKRPLFSHSVIKVRPFIVVGGKADTGNHRQLRLHMVRGHFKRKKNGLFWWSMHARGLASEGVVQHDYELEGR
jgi:hypothetical protein